MFIGPFEHVRRAGVEAVVAQASLQLEAEEMMDGVRAAVSGKKALS
jgi:hypothetical protein